jgi:hypothetical protein
MLLLAFLESMTSPAEPAQLRSVLSTGLRRVGCGRLCHDEPERFRDQGTTASVVISSSIFLGLTLFLIAFFDLGVLSAAAIVFGSLLIAALGLMVRRSDAAGTVLLFFVVAWFVTLIVRIFTDGFAEAVLWYGVPFLAIIVGLWMWRVIRLAAEIPLMLPVALIVVVFPLLSADVWQLGNALGLQLIALAAVSVLPLLVFVLGRLSRFSVHDVFVDTAKRVEEEPNPEESAVRLLEDLLNSEEKKSFNIEKTRSFFGDTLGGSALSQEAAGLAATLRKSFRRRIFLQVIPLTLGIAMTVAAFIYVLAMAAVPAETAQQWVGSPISTGSVALAGVEITLQLGPYLMVPALLAVISTAVFLAFVLTEDRYSLTLYDALIYKPARRWILLGIPYSKVRARWGDPGV